MNDTEMNDTAKINRAIRAGIRECFGSNAILAQIARYLDKLRETEGWKESEVRLVESGIRQMLKGMLSGENRSSRETPAQKSA
ncbi:MAG TPA: hypothetical protein VGM05_11845 [Planctomycetaceae bacterium]|jgi:hypothetical protein